MQVLFCIVTDLHRPPRSSCSAHRPPISRRPPEELESIHALRTPDLDKFLPPKVGASFRGWGGRLGAERYSLPALLGQLTVPVPRLNEEGPSFLVGWPAYSTARGALDGSWLLGSDLTCA